MTVRPTLFKLAETLLRAEIERKPVAPLSSQQSDLTLDDAYAIQGINANQKMKEGARLLGYKVGLTSREAQKHFNLFHPDFGHLFNTMWIPNDSELYLDELIQPRIEGEIAFIMGRDLKGPGITIVDVISAIDSVVGAFEIIDSRIENWKITGTDTVADNGSSARFVLSEKRVLLQDVDLPSIGMALYQNGEVAITGAGSAVMGNPLNAVVFVANEIGKLGRDLKAGDVVLSGSVGGMIPMRPNGFYVAEFLKLGRITLRAREKKS